MTVKLYYNPGVCSMAAHIAMLESSIPYELELVEIHNKENSATKEYMKKVPFGQVPAIEDEGFIMEEGGAILVYLLDKYSDHKLLPKDGKERAMALQWLMFANATLHPAYSEAFSLQKKMVKKEHSRHIVPNSDSNKLSAAAKDLLDSAIYKIQGLWNRVEDQLSKAKYIAGNEMTAGDILLTVIANWTKNLQSEKKITFGSKTQNMIREVVNKKSYQEALVKEGVTYNYKMFDKD